LRRLFVATTFQRAIVILASFFFFFFFFADTTLIIAACLYYFAFTPFRFLRRHFTPLAFSSAKEMRQSAFDVAGLFRCFHDTLFRFAASSCLSLTVHSLATIAYASRYAIVLPDADMLYAMIRFHYFSLMLFFMPLLPFFAIVTLLPLLRQDIYFDYMIFADAMLSYS